jgi:hypothetical protein
MDFLSFLDKYTFPPVKPLVKILLTQIMVVSIEK